ncbi:Cytochrome P450 monooxygenase 205 [Psilocybe cubensis]|uniref:Cytochrome P450 monooxygenase 205 n=2 Tax=Psilocybe cubensis TaxID=181762 RepID=A0ACB8H6G1_PSICU|nr:Cytochrome P450 monooxygenase 205 [Psilocybe cubensis]KAH9483580.1 Cytochrome P450 monooxygenase 205 [Psilocybe cubensis]
MSSTTKLLPFDVPSSLGQFIWSAIAPLALYTVYKLVNLIHEEATSPLRGLPGPESPSFIWGNIKDIWNSTDSAIYDKWVEEHGSTIKYMGPAGLKRLYTTDLKAINHILVNSYDYPKPESAVYNIKRILGEGVLLVEGDIHKQQNPAFGPQQIRELTEIFIEKAIQLRDIWSSEIKRQNDDGPAKVDALSWLSRLTLDVIGLAGFNYNFHALTDDPELNELSKAFAIMFKTGTKIDVIGIMRGIFPWLRFLPADRDAEAKQASQTMFRVGTELLEKTKACIKKEESNKRAWAARDLLSILVRANAMPDIPESQRLLDKDVLAQIPTFLIAGHETTSIATTWALYSLTQNKDSQTKLREELLTVSTDNPTMDELNALSYLDAVVRETLRVHAPVPATMRVASKDDVLPLNVPYTDKTGKKHYEVHVRKGQTVIIPITPINRSKSLWGEDASLFKPERWYNIPEDVAAIPGVWGNTLSFLGGPRACIGYRFALVEMKALLFTLVRAFEFELAVPASEIQKKSVIVTRPVLASDPNKSNQMPLLVRHVIL